MYYQPLFQLTHCTCTSLAKCNRVKIIKHRADPHNYISFLSELLRRLWPFFLIIVTSFEGAAVFFFQPTATKTARKVTRWIPMESKSVNVPNLFLSVHPWQTAKNSVLMDLKCLAMAARSVAATSVRCSPAERSVSTDTPWTSRAVNCVNVKVGVVNHK